VTVLSGGYIVVKRRCWPEHLPCSPLRTMNGPDPGSKEVSAVGRRTRGTYVIWSGFTAIERERTIGQINR
jgi:hypothetical protein